MGQRRATVPLMVRLPGALHQRLALEAKKEHRSLNAQFVHRLEQSIQQEAAGEMLNKVKEERDTAVALLNDAQRMMKRIDALLAETIGAAMMAAKSPGETKK